MSLLCRIGIHSYITYPHGLDEKTTRLRIINDIPNSSLERCSKQLLKICKRYGKTKWIDTGLYTIRKQ